MIHLQRARRLPDGKTGQSSDSKKSELPGPPRRLSRPEKRVWRELHDQVELEPCDLTAFEVLVTLVYQYREAMDQVRENGAVVAAKKSGVLQHDPNMTLCRNLEPQITRLCRELGMTPATRKRLKLDNRNRFGGNDFEDL